MTDARTIRALYCNELEMSAGHEQRTAMQWSRNHFGQLGRLAVCAMGRSDSAWMHGGEHLSGRFGLNCGGTLAPDEFRPHDVPVIGASCPAVHFAVLPEQLSRLALKKHSQEVAARAIAVPNVAQLPNAGGARLRQLSLLLRRHRIQ